MRPLDRLFHESFFIAELCALPILALLLRYSLLQRAKSEQSAGELLLRVVRPRVKVWKTVGLVWSWLVVNRYVQGAQNDKMLTYDSA
jgi:hypothetical protein